MQFMVVLAFSTRFNLELFVVAGTKTRQDMPDVRRVLTTVHHCVPTIYLHHLYCVLKEPQDHLSRLVVSCHSCHTHVPVLPPKLPLDLGLHSMTSMRSMWVHEICLFFHEFIQLTCGPFRTER